MARRCPKSCSRRCAPSWRSRRERPRPARRRQRGPGRTAAGDGGIAARCARLGRRAEAGALPARRNRLRAHVTLFHALPPSSEGEVRRLLGDFARRPPPAARVSGLFDLGRGTAWDLASPALVAMHAEIADSLHGILVGQEMRELRPHITIQNKVAPQAARALQAQLRTALPEVAFRFHGLGLYAWDDALWRPLHTWPFRGRD